MRFNDRRIFLFESVFVILHNFFNAGGLRNGNSADCIDVRRILRISCFAEQAIL